MPRRISISTPAVGSSRINNLGCVIIARAITSVLLEAWYAGALKGDIPEQAFLVRCDEATNPPENEELGQVLCEVYVAPAVPMEFITLRVAISREGRLEATET